MIFVSPKVGKGDFPTDHSYHMYRTQTEKNPTEKTTVFCCRSIDFVGQQNMDFCHSTPRASDKQKIRPKFFSSRWQVDDLIPDLVP